MDLEILQDWEDWTTNVKARIGKTPDAERIAPIVGAILAAAEEIKKAVKS